jgi:hypothetical protein
MNERWRVCLHEAGHAQYGLVKLGDKTGYAVVLSDSDGVYTPGIDAVPGSFDEAACRACGRAAESLIDCYGPPECVPMLKPAVMPGPSDVSAFAEIKKNVCDTRAAGFGDSEVVARWCVLGCASEPERWIRRHRVITRTAEYFVRCHAAEILGIARQLYADGIFFISKGIR